jgi:hypothetical protein
LAVWKMECQATLDGLSIGRNDARPICQQS